jgi:hypothetical protein
MATCTTRSKTPRRTGGPVEGLRQPRAIWTKDELHSLEKAVKAGATIEEIARASNRSKGAIVAQVYRLGLSEMTRCPTS